MLGRKLRDHSIYSAEYDKSDLPIQIMLYDTGVPIERSCRAEQSNDYPGHWFSAHVHVASEKPTEIEKSTRQKGLQVQTSLVSGSKMKISNSRRP